MVLRLGLLGGAHAGWNIASADGHRPANPPRESRGAASVWLSKLPGLAAILRAAVFHGGHPRLLPGEGTLGGLPLATLDALVAGGDLSCGVCSVGPGSPATRSP